MKFLKTLKEFSKSVEASSPIKTQELYGRDKEDPEVEKWYEDLDKKREDYFKREKKSSRKKIKDESHTLSKEASKEIDNFLKGKDKKRLEDLYFGVNKLIAQEEVKEDTSSNNDLGDLASMFEDNPKVNQEMPELEEDEKSNPAEDILNSLEKRKEEKSVSKEEVKEEPKEEPKNYDLGKLLIIFDNTDYNSDILHALKEAGFDKEHYKYEDRSYNTEVEGPDKYSKYVVDSKLVEVDSREVIEDMFDDLLSELGSYYRDGSINLEGEGPRKEDMEERIKKVS